jgi:DnaJ domain
MPQLIIALIIVFGGLWLIRRAARTSPAAMPGFMAKVAGFGIMGFAGWLALLGRMQIAVPLFVFGLGLAGKGQMFPQGFNWGKTKTPGQKSRVATSLLTMELDHDSGVMDGDILSGAAKGRRLSSLTQDELVSFHTLCRKSADQSQALFEAWLDRAQPEWRSTWGEGAKTANQGNGAMTREEAYAVLGLKNGASPSDIKQAHKRLMKDFHPDKGGSDYLASKINAAKDVLLG